MKRQKRFLTHALVLLALLTFASVPASAKDREFDAIARHIKSTYRGKRVRIPFLGLANFAVKIVRPAGVKSFKLATFENLQKPEPGRESELASVIRQSLDPAWRPLVRVRSRDGEQTFIYIRDAGDNVKLMVVSLEATEATVIRVKVSPKTLMKWINQPEILGVRMPLDH